MLQKHGEPGSDFKYVNLDPRFYLDEIALVLIRDVFRCVIRQGECFKVAGIQANGSFSLRNDHFSIASDDASDNKPGYGDDH